MSRLKPCPFCGGEAEFEHSYREDGHRYPRDFWHVRIVCAKCFHETEWEEYGKQENEANDPEDKARAETEIASAWNTRPREDRLQAQVDAIVKLVEKYNSMEDMIIGWSLYNLDFPHELFGEFREMVEDAKESCHELGLVEV